jgi:pimeloyl-ACP methyl ester carboxylesterase
MYQCDGVLVHGAGGGGWQWRDWCPVLESFAIRCHPLTLQPADEGLRQTRYRDYVGQIVAAIEACTRPTVLVGVSMGGILALKAAEVSPLAGLVLVNSVPPAGIEGWHPPRSNIPDVVAWSRKLSLEETWRSMPEADEATARWAHGLWRDESGPVLRSLYQGVPATTPAIPRVVVTGRSDRTIKPSVNYALARYLRTDVMEFEGVSHVGILLGNRAPFIARMTAAWLQQALPPPA